MLGRERVALFTLSVGVEGFFIPHIGEGLTGHPWSKPIPIQSMNMQGTKA